LIVLFSSMVWMRMIVMIVMTVMTNARDDSLDDV